MLCEWNSILSNLIFSSSPKQISFLYWKRFDHNQVIPISVFKERHVIKIFWNSQNLLVCSVCLGEKQEKKKTKKKVLFIFVSHNYWPAPNLQILSRPRFFWSPIQEVPKIVQRCAVIAVRIVIVLLWLCLHYFFFFVL